MTALAASTTAGARTRRRFERLAPAAAAAMLADGAVRFIDIRPPSVRAREGAVPGADLVERAAFSARLDPESSRRLPWAAVDRPVVVICSRGVSSSLAAADLLDLGYTTVYDVEGGFQAWRAAGLRTA